MTTASTSGLKLQLTPMVLHVWADTAVATTKMRQTPSVVRRPAPASVSADLPWVDAQLKMLEQLPANWDGYGADKIEVVRLNQIGAILDTNLPYRAPAGSIVPGADGSLQAEWHTHSGSFGIVLDDFGRVSAWRHPVGESEIEASGLAAIDLLRYAAMAAMI